MIMSSVRNRGFSLIEVIVAISMFAIIAVPALSLMTLSARKANNRIGLSNATELKRKVEGSIAESGSAFSWDLATSPQVLYANENLSEIDYAGSGIADSNKFYRIDILDPIDYDSVYDESTDPYRIFVFKVRWPAYIETAPGTYVDNQANDSNLEETVMTSAISK